jgi:hypothetical protein
MSAEGGVPGRNSERLAWLRWAALASSVWHSSLLPSSAICGRRGEAGDDAGTLALPDDEDRRPTDDRLVAFVLWMPESIVVAKKTGFLGK